MNRKLAVTIMFFFLGLATWDAFLDHEDSDRVAVSGDEATVRAFEDGTGIGPVRP